MPRPPVAFRNGADRHFPKFDIFLLLWQYYTIEIKYMRKIDLKNVVWKEGKYYVSWNLNTGISSFGDTKKEAMKSLQEALELYFEDVSPSKITKVEHLDIVPLAFNHA